MRGGGDQFPLFMNINARERTAEQSAAPIAHLDKHHTIAIAHDQVDFAMPTTVVLLHQPQPLRLKKTAGMLFCSPTLVQGVSPLSAQLAEGNLRITHALGLSLDKTGPFQLSVDASGIVH